MAQFDSKSQVSIRDVLTSSLVALTRDSQLIQVSVTVNEGTISLGSGTVA